MRENIMNELSLFNSLFNNVFDNAASGYAYNSTSVPKVDVKETKTSYVLEMDLPGRTEKDINVEIDGNVLTIASVKETAAPTADETAAPAAETEKSRWLIRERRQSQFTRRFTLPDDVDSEKISAVFKNGVLFLTIARKEIAAPRRITIDVA